MNALIRSAVAALAALALAVPARGVLIRHDRDDAAYRALAARLPFAGQFGSIGGGTLIGPRLVLTAAHVARAAERSSALFALGGGRFGIAALLLHPEWKDAGPGSPKDLALVLLDGAPAAASARLCATAGQPGDGVLLAGAGDFGTGASDVRHKDGVRRAAQNAVDRRDPSFLVLRFDAPPGAVDLEGIGGPGDSGGGLFRDADAPCLLGVSAWGEGDGHGPGRYGALDGYADAVAEAAWIATTSQRLSTLAEEAEPTVDQRNRGHDTPAARAQHGQRVELGAGADSAEADATPAGPPLDVEAARAEQLVDHSSGLGDIFTDRFEALRTSLRTLRDYLPLFTGRDVQFEPGSRHRYSNAGFVVLGLILERVTEEDYYALCARRIFTPAGMSATASPLQGEPFPDRARSYTRRAGPQLTDADAAHPARGSSAGGGYSTAPDLLRFARALREGKLVPAAWRDWILGGSKSFAGATPPASGPTAIGFAGGSDGVNALLLFEGDDTIVVLSNLDPPSAEALGRPIARVLGRIAP